MVRCPGGVLLIDMGIGPRTTARRLEGSGVGLEDVRAICLTHLDRDHFNLNWFRTILKRGIRLFCHASRAEAVLAAVQDSGARAAMRELLQPFDGASFAPLRGLEAQAIRFAHDEAGSHGFVIRGYGARMGYASDLGRVPEQLFECFEDLDLLALESNYDPQMELGSARPWFLKERIMGGFGHLSNEQAFAAVCRVLNRCEKKGHRLPGHIVLLHRSRECNCPKLLRKLFSQDARIAPRLTLAEQNEPSKWLKASREKMFLGEQMVLAWG